MDDADIDYSKSSMSIRAAMIDLVARYPDKARRPTAIRWGSLRVMTSDKISVPEHGIVRLSLISGRYSPRQGVDMRVEGGGFKLVSGTVGLLRTVYDTSLEDEVTYEYASAPGIIYIWNVYEVSRGARNSFEKWTGNAGFVKETLSKTSWLYRCNDADESRPPQFDSLVFSLSVAAGV